MEYETAVQILGLDIAFDEKELKTAYYKMALRYHPDKNKTADASECFRQCKQAYDVLRDDMHMNVDEVEMDYGEMIKKCLSLLVPGLNWKGLFIDTTIFGLVRDCEKISLQVFSGLGKDRALEVYELLSKYQDVFQLSDGLLSDMGEIIKCKMAEDNRIVLNPQLADLLSDKVFKLEIFEKAFYVPLWHTELCFDISGNDLIVVCIPELEEHVRIDNNNNVYSQFSGKISDVLRDGEIVVKLGGKLFKIPGENLSIKKHQTYVFRNSGLLIVDDNHMYDTSTRGHIYVDIRLE